MKRSRERKLAALPLILTAFFGLGCAIGEPPEFTVVGAEIAEETDDAVLLRLKVQGANRNDYPLELRAARYSVRLNGQRVFAARRWPQATLPAFGAQPFELPVPIPRQADVTPLEDDATYRLSATITHIGPSALARTLFDAGLRRPTTNFVETGRLAIDPAEPEETEPRSAPDSADRAESD